MDVANFDAIFDDSLSTLTTLEEVVQVFDVRVDSVTQRWVSLTTGESERISRVMTESDGYFRSYGHRDPRWRTRTHSQIHNETPIFSSCSSTPSRPFGNY